MSPEHANVIIVDDNDKYSFDMKRFLTRKEHEVVEVCFGIFAVQLLLNSGVLEAYDSQVWIVDGELTPHSQPSADGMEVIGQVSEYARIHKVVKPYLIGNPLTSKPIYGADVNTIRRGDFAALEKLVRQASNSHTRSRSSGVGFSF